MQRKVRSIESRVLFTKEERRDVDRFLAALERSADCKVTFADATRALWKLILEKQARACSQASQYAFQRPSYSDEAGLAELTHTLSVAFEEAIRKRR